MHPTEQLSHTKRVPNWVFACVLMGSVHCASQTHSIEDAASSDTLRADVLDEHASVDVPVIERDVTLETDTTSPDTLRVLFVGNSYTYVNDLPTMVSEIARSSGLPPSIETQSVTAGGATLQIHWDNPAVQSAIANTRWSAVVLQGQSVEPLYSPQSFDRYADRFGALLRDRGIAPLWFATWARRAADPLYGEVWSGGTPMQMSLGLENAYLRASQRNGGELVRVGASWITSLSEQPTVALHVDDGSHPTTAGTYLAACMFYSALTHHRVPETAAVPMGLDAATARSMREIATRTSNLPLTP